MRPTASRLLTRPIPLTSVPPHALRLPPTPKPKPNLSTVSPTLDRLLAAKTPLPPNLRVNEYVPKRKEFRGVQRGHRDLVGFPPALPLSWLSELTRADPFLFSSGGSAERHRLRWGRIRTSVSGRGTQARRTETRLYHQGGQGAEAGGGRAESHCINYPRLSQRAAAA